MAEWKVEGGTAVGYIEQPKQEAEPKAEKPKETKPKKKTAKK